MTKKVIEEMKTYVIQREGDTIRITVPASWKVTFGPGVPGRDKYSGGIGWALRFYEANDKQRAIYTNVKSFYDASIKTERLVKTTKTESKGEFGPKGSKENAVVDKTEEWVPA